MNRGDVITVKHDGVQQTTRIWDITDEGDVIVWVADFDEEGCSGSSLETVISDGSGGFRSVTGG